MRPLDIGAVQIERRYQLAVRPVRHERPQGRNRGVDTLADVVTVVIARFAVLALVAGLDAILVHEGNRKDLDVPPEPVPVVGVRECRFQHAFHDVVRHHLTGMVSGREQESVRRITVESADVQALNAPPALRLAEFLYGHVRVALESSEELFEVLLLVWYGEAEPHVFGIRRECVLERSIPHSLRAEPGPTSPTVRACSRATHADGIPTAETKSERTPSRPTNAKAPVEPPSRRVAQVGPKQHGIALDLLDDDIAAGIIGIDNHRRGDSSLPDSGRTSQSQQRQYPHKQQQPTQPTRNLKGRHGSFQGGEKKRMRHGGFLPMDSCESVAGRPVRHSAELYRSHVTLSTGQRSVSRRRKEDSRESSLQREMHSALTQEHQRM